MGLRDDYVAKLVASGGRIIRGRSTKYVQIFHPYLNAGEFFWLGSRGSVRRGKTVKDSYPAVRSMGSAIRWGSYKSSLPDPAVAAVESAVPPKNWEGPQLPKAKYPAEKRTPPVVVESAADRAAREKAEREAEYFASLIA